MKRTFFLILLTCSLGLLLTHPAQAQNKYTISGDIQDKASGEELIGANVIVKELGTGTVTNAYGFYSLTVPQGSYTIEFSYLGFKTISKPVELTSDVRLNIELEEEGQTLKEFVARGEKKDKNISENKMSVVKLDVRTVKRIPLLMGEVDIIKSVQLLPGVQAAGDGSTNLIVRGGNIDHNLVMLDEAIVYNPSHAVGFFSVFNADAVKDFELYKGGIPSQFGGRLASVMDIRMRDGNSKRFAASGGIGLLSSRLTLEGPLAKDKSSFIVSGRRTYFDVFLKASPNEDVRDNTAFFYDLNAKANYKINDKNKLFLSGYFGRDKLGFAGLFSNGWGNQTGTLRWNHLFSKKLFSNVTFIFSRYDYQLEFDAETQNLRYESDIRDIGLKSDFTYFIAPKNTLRFGFWSTHHHYFPGGIKPLNDRSIFNEVKLNDQTALEQAFYVSNQRDLNSRLNVEYGIRYSRFDNVANDDTRIFTYTDDMESITDTTTYKNGDFFNAYHGLEPRLSFRYTLNSKSSIKASYNRMRQYVHLVTNVSASVGTELWVPSNPNIKPQIADQVAAGYFRNFFDDQLETSVEVYYKDMQNVLDIKDNANVLLNTALAGELRAGKGRAYGIEFFVRKQQGKTTGWVSYTLARSEREIPGINQGRTYPFRFDRRHSVSIVMSQEVSKRILVSANWVYSSGEAVTFPVARYEVDGKTVPYYSERNGYRLPAYHRMDLSVTLMRKQREGVKYKNESNLVFSVYNVYARKNIYSIAFREREITTQDSNGNDVTTTVPGETEAVKTYLFTLVPSITYNFKF